MGRLWSKRRGPAAAERGQIIQRVLVDGWSAERAAEAIGVTERQVARWVADYRRRGMASLRDDDAAEPALRRWLRRVNAAVAECLIGLPRPLHRDGSAPCIELRRVVDEQHRH